MAINTTNINILWGSIIVEELIRNGIDHFCISPGSRSAPLTTAVAENQRAKHIIFFDERGAAFHALGYARATAKPAVLICTSGTAAANYLPAVVEASVDYIPMIILTADRPPELHQTGANQAINQIKLYGEYVKWEFSLPCPDDRISPQMVLTTIDQAIFQSRCTPQGVVHVNCMFREPLAPRSEPIKGNYLQPIAAWKEGNDSFTKYELPIKIAQPEVIREVADTIDNTKRGVILAGGLSSKSEAESVLKLSQKVNWPIFADITSGLRFQLSKTNVIPYYDQLLLVEQLLEKLAPGTVLQFGSRIVSKRVMEFIEHVKPRNYLQVLDHPFRHDPMHAVTHRIEADIGVFCKSLLDEVSSKPPLPWLASLIESSNVVESLLNAYVHPEQNVSEVSAARIVSQSLGEKSALFLASSMPVRDMDMFASPNGGIIPVASNRGGSGIDGTLASACGYAVGIKLPLTLMIGDLAMIHDLNSLALLRSVKQPLIIIIINNNGSGIFSFLPIADFENIFEEYFGTPHELTFDNAAAMFEIDYYRPKTNQEFQKGYQEILMNEKTAIIEIKTDRKENLNLHEKIQERIRIAFQS